MLPLFPANTVVLPGIVQRVPITANTAKQNHNAPRRIISQRMTIPRRRRDRDLNQTPRISIVFPGIVQRIAVKIGFRFLPFANCPTKEHGYATTLIKCQVKLPSCNFITTRRHVFQLIANEFKGVTPTYIIPLM